jgi:hypothetical protein
MCMQENQLANYSKEGGDRIFVTPLYTLELASWHLQEVSSKQTLHRAFTREVGFLCHRGGLLPARKKDALRNQPQTQSEKHWIR